MKVLALALWSLAHPAAQDAQLAALRATVMSLRRHPNDHRETRGATAELTGIRNYIEMMGWATIPTPQCDA